MNPMDLKRGIDKAVRAALQALKQFLHLVQTAKRLLKSVLFLLTLTTPLVT
jgi:chaperonin GroEL (HSP60 family)